MLKEKINEVVLPYPFSSSGDGFSESEHSIEAFNKYGIVHIDLEVRPLVEPMNYALSYFDTSDNYWKVHKTIATIDFVDGSRAVSNDVLFSYMRELNDKEEPSLEGFLAISNLEYKESLPNT